MKKKSSSQSAFFNIRVLIGLFIVLAGVFVTLLGFGGFSNVFAQPKISVWDSAGLFPAPAFSAQSSYGISRSTLPTTGGGSALDGFDPNANGVVRVVVVQPDGKILIGGDFTNIGSHIARLNPDGTPDTDFNMNAAANGNTVLSIAVQGDTILVGGSFTSIGGAMHNNIARLDRLTGLADPNFNPNANNRVFSIAVQVDGKILIGGDFTNIGSHIARLNPDGTPDTAFNLNATANNVVVSIAIQADTILVGGDFTSIGGQPRNRIARLDATGLADSWDPNANGFVVYSIAVQADGQILVGGDFTSIGGQPRNRIARLDATGLADPLFNPNANNAVFSIAVQADGKSLAGGQFTALSPNGGAAVTRNNIARLETDGLLDRTLNRDETFGNFVYATAVQPDGKILIGGSFATGMGGAVRYNIARLNTDGTLDTAFNPNPNHGVNTQVLSIAVQADGKILVGGAFSSIGGQPRNHIARLNANDGSADPLFNPNANNVVTSIAVQADGKILAGGFFTTLWPNGGPGPTVTRHYIARLNTGGTVDTAFNPNANSGVLSIAVQADGKILAGGYFTALAPNGGQTVTRNHVARLNTDGTVATGFNPNANDYVYAIAVQADGDILAGGRFTALAPNGGPTVTRNHIARLNTDGMLDTAFDPNANNNVDSIAVQADGKILICGDFTNIGSHIARLNPDGTPDTAFNLNATANNNVDSIAVQADGKILAGGQFSIIGGQTRNLFARLSNDTAALQNLAVTQTTITWTLGGSSSQFTRVTFEYSTDNVHYTPLGNGTAADSTWTLTGFEPFLTGLNFYIRARGYYRSGYLNGSESITESVRNAFIPGPAHRPPPPPRSRPTPHGR